MDPAIDDEWRAAIMPVAFGVMAGHEMTPEGLKESVERLQGRGVPGWAAGLRAHLISAGWQEIELWVPEFTLRSELSLVGLQLLYPKTNARIATYKRVLLRFFHEALKPFEEEAAQNDYVSLALLRRFYERLDTPIAASEWQSALNAITAEHHRAVSELSSPNSQAMVDLLALVRVLFRDWQFALLRPSEADSWWKNPRTAPVSDLVSRLNRQHQWRAEGAASDDGGGTYTNLIADAYLAALEVECPAPEWMPRI